MLTADIKPSKATARKLVEYLSRIMSGDSGSKMRRTTYTWLTPWTYAPMEITLNQPGERSSTQDISFTLRLRMEWVLVGKSAFVENTFFKPFACVLPLFRTWLHELLPDLPLEVLSSITADDCTIRDVSASYYFTYPTETKTFQALCDFFGHGLVCLNSSAPYPSVKSRGKVIAPRIRTVEDGNHALSVDLVHLPAQEKFGDARVSLMRSFEDQPKAFSSETPSRRELLRATARRLLRIEVTVDTSKNLHFGENQNYQLPADYRKWTQEHLPHDPAWAVFEAMKYGLFLNHVTPTSEDEIDMINLDQGAREVLADHIEEKNLRHSDWIESTESLLHYRKTLLESAQIDILVPWSVAKLNKSRELNEQLTYESRFRPSEDEMLQPHCLSATNVDEKIAALLAKLPPFVTKEDPWPTTFPTAQEGSAEASDA
ncbi:hypothetical protein [Variovorax guangxiensis]|uniref:Uncharacterized protein n=1 Tax=Variovorax guangxiensis TaxID=1775474 RepID=A0A840FPU8_9BURK|nr:hypothetical protein [Variovorax guangxiensis]MBB4223963.1 hypothetical protein [Variovorax guangxiensis]